MDKQTDLTTDELNAAALLCERWGAIAFKASDRVLVSLPTGADWITMTPELLNRLVSRLRAALVAPSPQEGLIINRDGRVCGYRSPQEDEWRLVRPGEVGPVHGGHGSWVETDHPAVIACMGSALACQENGCQLAATPSSLEQQARIDELEALVEAKEATIMAVVHTIGGTVEGQPTHRGNFLQRVRQLVDAEGKA